MYSNNRILLLESADRLCYAYTKLYFEMVVVVHTRRALFEMCTHVRDVAQVLKQAEVLGPDAYPVERQPPTKPLAHRAEPERGRLLPLAVRVHVSRLRACIIQQCAVRLVFRADGRMGGWAEKARKTTSKMCRSGYFESNKTQVRGRTA